jgi:thioredoxin 1
MSSLSPTPAPPALWVVCLCADWCGLCRDYRQVLEQLARQAAPAQTPVRFVWFDIEDQAGHVGDLDIETFPTVLVADAEGVLFLGALTPHLQTLSRLLESLQLPGTRRAVHSEVTQKLLDALPGLPEHWV